MTGGVDIKGRWRVAGDQLLMDMQELPPNTGLFGGRWNGKTLTIRVKTLTGHDLQFTDSDLKFQRLQESPGKK